MTEKAKKMNVRYLSCGSDSNLLAKGIHSAEDVIAAAIACGEIDEEFAQEFKGDPVSGWWHAVPCPDGGCEYHGSKQGVRGSFLGTFVPMENY